MAGVSNIVAAGFGSWSSVEYVPTLGFGISTAAVYTPVAHYHALEGVSKQAYALVGATNKPHALQGPPNTIHELKGSN
jgi:phage tail tape-measure protein